MKVLWRELDADRRIGRNGARTTDKVADDDAVGSASTGG
jgi:hypothetical protein